MRRFVNKSRSLRKAKSRGSRTHSLNLRQPPRGGTRL